jgi:hypothetical protein
MAKKRVRRTKAQIELDNQKDSKVIIQQIIDRDLGKIEQPKGLGDTIANFTHATGIDKAVKFILGDDCGCKERQAKLNTLFPYNKPNCLTESEYEWLTEFFNSEGMRRATPEIIQSQKDPLLTIDARVFNRRKTQSMSCVGCWIDLVNRLRKVYETYEKN